MVYEGSRIHEEDLTRPLLCFIDNQEHGLGCFGKITACKPGRPRDFPWTENDGFDQI